MTTHELKTWPEPFADMWRGQKRHELRYNDRGYHVGDFLVLREFDPNTRQYSGLSMDAHVLYLAEGGTVLAAALDPEYVIMSVQVLHRRNRGVLIP